MSKPWGVGNWAEEAEREEAEEKERAAAAATAAPLEAFPTLGEAASVKPRKKKQQNTFSLAELTIGKSVAPGSRSRASMSDSRGLTPEEMMMLPTGPRDRSSEEEHRGGLGGAFRDYRDYNRVDRDQNRGGFNREREGGGFLRDRERDRDEPSRADDSSDWSSLKKPGVSGGFDGDRRGSRLPAADRDPPSLSLADEVDNWGFAKKSLPLAPVDTRRRGTFDDSKQQSRADEVDNWGSSKRSLPPPPPRGQDPAHSRADDVDNWASSKKVPPTGIQYRGQDPHMQDSGADFGGRWGKRPDYYQPQATEEPQRRRLVIAPPSHQSSSPPGAGSETINAMKPVSPGLLTSKANPFGSARPREDVLASRGPDLRGPKTEFGVLEHNSSRPSSSHSSRPDTPEVRAEATARPRPKVNPFGDAKPREVLLQERGMDWRKMDFEYEHRGVDRPETEEETLLKEQIKALKEVIDKQNEAAGAQQMNGVVADAQTTATQLTDLHALTEELSIKEKQFEDLIRALDDKVRFSQKIGDRPGSRSGRSDIGRSHDTSDSRPGSQAGSRPASRSGRSDVGRNYDVLERPSSQSGRRNFDSSESPRSQSGYGGGGRWSRSGQFEGNREQLERMGSWTGSTESRRSFDSLQRPRRRAGNLPTEVGGGVAEYSQEYDSVNVWTRSNEPSHDRRGSWAGRERVSDRGAYRRY